MTDGAGPATRQPAVSVLVPTYGQAAFVRRALDSLVRQSFPDWEAHVVIDGSIDDTPALVEPYRDDPRIHVSELEWNSGIGAALNVALHATAAPLVAYLPTDDVWHADHLATAVATLAANPDAALAYAGIRHHYNRTSLEPLPDGIQLVQVVHRRTSDRWLERSELVTDDLERMYWGRLRERGPFVATGRVTCEWVDHPLQHSKVVREPIGGINPYRLRYRVREPMRYDTTVGDRIDEVERYRSFRDRPDTPLASDGLRILLVGELSYNPERILALEERGHRLFGLWTPDPYWYNAVGPQPFGHVTDVPTSDPRAAIEAVRPDVIYGLLNWQAVPFAARVLRASGGTPFVWHFKEGPFICLEKGSWADLIELTSRADGVIHSSAEMRDWFATVVPDAADPDRELVLDGDLPKADWFRRPFSGRLSDTEGEIHTVVPGRPIGLHPETVAELAGEGIHLHFYGDFTQGQWRAWIERSASLAPGYLHLHPTVDQRGWVEEFSRYDAGWLHVFESANGGELHRANWDDLNLPARMATLAAAGVPMIQRDNSGSIVAAQALAERLGVGISFRSAEGLGAALRAEVADRAIATRVRDARDAFAFDTHADRLIRFLRTVVDRRAPAVVPAIRAFGGGRRRDTKLQDARGTSPG
ncbi:MAG TPA: glycosyltransferase [Candidatus Limnocylindrales bacterium]|nr:glycosyltransferase [Candidatus Limnocylindrales bacterium]